MFTFLVAFLFSSLNPFFKDYRDVIPDLPWQDTVLHYAYTPEWESKRPARRNPVKVTGTAPSHCQYGNRRRWVTL